MSNFLNYIFNAGWTYWFVSYAHSKGFGNICIMCNSYYLDVQATQDKLKIDNKDDQIVALGFQRINKDQWKVKKEVENGL